MSCALKSDCRKFAPNIFNKSKCQNCFRTKDSHTAEALENNRATRKVSKCGYLFVAPDWDFSQSINRTRRWQRRWFVLYDDGELTFSVDEHPDTVPQAVIDMNKVLEVTDAEDVTGNQFSIAITAPEKVYFIKGTGQDESKWWFDVLSRFPRNTVRGKNKRNATFPGLKATSTPIVFKEEQTKVGSARPRFLSSTREIEEKTSQPVWNDGDVFPTRDHVTNGRTSEANNQKEDLCSHQNENLIDFEHSSQNKISVDDTVELVKGRSRRYLKRESRGLKGQRSRSDGVAKMIPSLSGRETVGEWPPVGLKNRAVSPRNYHHNPVYLLLSDKGKPFEASDSISPESHFLQQIRNDKGCSLVRQLLNDSSQETPQKDSGLHCSGSFSSADAMDWCNANRPAVVPFYKTPLRTKTPSAHHTESLVKNVAAMIPVRDIQPDSQYRGVPDGCGLDHSMENKLESLSEDLFVKKGWLMRLGCNKEWFKHWFVLRNSALTYYSDPTAEDSGILNGVLDLQLVKAVEEIDSDRNYAFCIKTWEDKKQMILTAVTAGIRSNWIQAIRQAVSNWNSSHSIKNPMSHGMEHTRGEENRMINDEHDNMVDASSSDDHSEYFSIIDDEESVDPSSRTLPPSPPLNRTAISKVKEKARSRSNSRSRRSRHPKGDKTNGAVEAEVNSDASDRSSSSIHCEGWPDIPDCSSSRKSDTQCSSEGEDGTVYRLLPGDSYCHQSRIEWETRCSRKAASMKELRTKKLEQRCRELEEQLQLKEQEVGERNMELEKMKNMRGSYRDLVEKYNNLKKKLEEQTEENKVDLLRSGQEDIWGKRRLNVERANINVSLEELQLLFVKSKEKLEDLKSRLEILPEKETWSPSLRDLSKLCGELEWLLSENENNLSKVTALLIQDSMGDFIRVEKALDLCRGEVFDSKTESLKQSVAVDLMKVQSKLSKAMEEIKLLKKELKDTQKNYDELDLNCYKLKQEKKNLEDLHQSQMALMTARVDDLTSKLTLSDKNLRQMKQKLAKAESKQEKRRLSLKGKDAVTISKEFEVKLSKLEHKIGLLEDCLTISGNEMLNEDGNVDEELRTSQKASIKRRPSQESLPGDSQSPLLRLHLLDQKVKQVSGFVEKDSADVVLLEKPKICIQTKRSEDGSNAEDGGEEWSTLSLATSVTDLQTLDLEDNDHMYPLTATECMEYLSHKVDSLLSWFRSSLQSLQKQDTPTPLSEEESVDSKLTSLSQILELVDHLAFACEEVPALFSGSDKTWIGLTYNLLLLQEVASAVHNLRDSDKDLMKMLITSLQRTDRVLASFESSTVKAMTPDRNKMPSEAAPSHMFPSLFVLQNVSLPLEEEQITVQFLSTTLESVLNSFRSVDSTVEQYKQNKQCSLLRRLSECLDVHPTSDMPPDNGQNIAEQEAVLAQITEAISKISTSIGWHLDKALYRQSSLLLHEKMYPVMQHAIRTSLQQEIDLLNYELRNSCLQCLESFCLVTLPKDSLDQHVIPVVTDLVMVISVYGVFKGYVTYLREQVDNVVLSYQQPVTVPEENSETKQMILDSVHEKLVEMVLILTGDVPAILDRWLTWCLKHGRLDHKSMDCVAPKITVSVSQVTERFTEKIQKEKATSKERINKLQDRLSSITKENKQLIREGCSTCESLREEVHLLQKKAQEMEKTRKNSSSCQKCKEWQMQLLQAVDKHKRELAATKQELQDDKDLIQKDFQCCLEAKDQEHEDTLKKVHSELQSTKHRLKCLEGEYETRIHSLQQQYEQKLAKRQDQINEEAVRHRYYSEIEQLKGLCEKGMTALENLHHCSVQRIEERRKKEVDRLEAEKKKALAEETQATLAALNALQRAHQEELHREITKVREDYLQKVHPDTDSEVLHKKHEQELEAIKQEIISLSEKYSVKCLENASLEERLQFTSLQLQEANFQVFDLLARNKQLTAHLVSDILHKKDSTCNESSEEELKNLLRLKESELMQQKEEHAQLLQTFHLAQMQISQLSSQCQKLNANLNAERSHREGEITLLQGKLEAIIAAAASELGYEEHNASRPVPKVRCSSLRISQPWSGNCEAKSWRTRSFTSTKTRELMRSPSCPGLGSPALENRMADESA